MKRGQLLGIPFVYILALIIAAFILIFGIRLIFELQETASSVEIANFIDSLRNEVEKYSYLDHGSSKEIKINLPNKIEQLCFKQVDINKNSLSQQEKNFMNLESSNIFFIPLDSYENTKFKINKTIKPFGDPKSIACISNPGSFVIESKKDYVKIIP